MDWSSKGYRIPRKHKGVMQTVKRDLVIKSTLDPFQKQGPPPSISCWRSDAKYVYVPLRYGIDTFGEPRRKFKSCAPLPISVPFNGELRGYQKEVVATTLAEFDRDPYAGGLWSLGTGTGKTVIALNLVAARGVKTLIVVHKKILMDQWVERIAQFLPSARVGRIQGTTTEIADRDIVIGMVQTMTQREYPPGTFGSFGMIIADEVHNMCSTTFNDIFFKVQCQNRIGLSATLKRKDGYDRALDLHIGKVLYTHHVVVVDPEIQFVDLPPNPEITMSLTRFGTSNIPALVTDLALNESRNAIIAARIVRLLEEDRKVLVLSDRVAQCTALADMVNLAEPGAASPFTGSMKSADLEAAMGFRVIAATYGIFKEGVDCPELDTLVMATPKVDVVQSVGRILRRKNANVPLVVDFVDSLGPLKAQFYKRKRYYLDRKYELRPW